MPEVSVVIPTCNRAGLLPAAIGSVLRQTFQDFEILVVDDCSADATPAVVERFADPRIRFLRHPARRGGGAARNTGIAHARGAYVAFLDDDDEWHPDKLERQMEVMRRGEPAAGAVYCGYRIVERGTGREQGRMTPKTAGDLSAELMSRNPIGGTSCMLVRRECLDKAGGFDERLPSFQDRDLWIRLARETRFAYVPEPLLDYYVHEKKVWTNPDALLKGLEIMLAKHGASAAFRKACARRYLFCGVKLCDAGRFSDGRRALRRSIALHPWAIKSYLYFALALLGPNVMSAVRARRAAQPAGRPDFSKP